MLGGKWIKDLSFLAITLRNSSNQKGTSLCYSAAATNCNDHESNMDLSKTIT